jgi:uncharacterized protein YneF (UPF0154 family)
LCCVLFFELIKTLKKVWCFIILPNKMTFEGFAMVEGGELTSSSDMMKKLDALQSKLMKTFVANERLQSQVKAVDISAFQAIEEKKIAENVQKSLLQMSQVVYKMAKFQSNTVTDAMVHLQSEEVVTRLSVREALGADLPSYLVDESKTLMEKVNSDINRLKWGTYVRHSLPVWEIGVFMLIALILYFAPPTLAIILSAFALTAVAIAIIVLAFVAGFATATFVIVMAIIIAVSDNPPSFEDLQRRMMKPNKRLSSLQMLENLGVELGNLANEISQPLNARIQK